MLHYTPFPKQALPISKKNEKWRHACLDWAKNKTVFGSEEVRNSVRHKQINCDLLNGKLHMEDLQLVINPEQLGSEFIPDTIQHYPIINSKINLLIGEEISRVFDYRVIITNPTSITEMEQAKTEEIVGRLQEIIESTATSEDEFNQKIKELQDYYNYNYQDIREMRANALLNHYNKQENFNIQFNKGFKEACCTGEEIYQCDIEGGEPVMKQLNGSVVRIFKSGYSNKVEDADIIIIEDYWSPGKIQDVFYDVLTEKDVKKIEELGDSFSGDKSGAIDENGIIDERGGFLPLNGTNGVFNQDGELFTWSTDASESLMPYDFNGNVRVLRMYWKSKRRIKKVKSYDEITGEIMYNFYPENYLIDETKGEEETGLYINQAWEGTLIGEDIYVNIQPKVVQYNSLSNPSKCHFGIIGSIYNFNDDRPYSLVDMMKPYNYLYDIIHDRLNSLIASNFGKLVKLDLAKVPKGWTPEKWLYYARKNKIVVEDSFKEGNAGASTGKLAGGLNNANSGVVDAELGNSIQYYTNLLEYIKMEMSDIVGISKQREGQISNRETVGGVERATLQSSHITEWLFSIHNDTKKRVLECFLDTAKIALKGKSMKFQYILPDKTVILVDIDGDEFCEHDYGLVIDADNTSQKLSQVIESLAQAAIQNQLLDFSTVVKLYSSASLAEKEKMIEKSENEARQRQQEAQQQEQQMQQQQIQAQMQQMQMQMQMQDNLNARDNETKLAVANINAQSKLVLASNEDDGIEEPMNETERAKLFENIRQFNERLSLDKAKLELDKNRLSFDKDKADTDARLKREQINKRASK